MAKIRETTRQKMINMMYLVLTGLLALNVSKDVIDSFMVVDETIVLSNHNYRMKLQDIYSDFERKNLLNPAKVGPFWEKAKLARNLSMNMIAYVMKVRNDLVSKTEGVPLDSAKNIQSRQIRRLDENSVSTNYFLGKSDDGSDGEARKLKNEIIKYKKDMVALLGPKNNLLVNIGLDTDGPFRDQYNVTQNWESHFFLNTVLAADITILDKIILDVCNIEMEVVNILYKSIGQGDFKFEKIEAKIVPKSNFVFLGENYQAEVIVAGFDTTTSQSQEVYCEQNISYLSPDEISQNNRIKSISGKILLNFPSTSEGIKKYAGFVRNRSSSGFEKDYHFSGSYFVSKPTSIISPTKMNVLYAGIDNPVSLTASGVSAESISAEISVGTITRDSKRDDWLVRVPANVNTAIIGVYAMVDGAKKGMGTKKFRIKKLPNPLAAIAGKNSGSINKDILIAAGAVTAQLPDDFDFDYNFLINSFTLTIQRGFKIFHYHSKNAYLTPEMIDQIKKTSRGQTIVFENLETLDPFNTKRYLTPMTITLE